MTEPEQIGNKISETAGPCASTNLRTIDDAIDIALQASNLLRPENEDAESRGIGARYVNPMTGISVMGAWDKPFDKELSSASKFIGLNGESKISLMKLADNLRYAATDNYEVVDLTIGGGKYHLQLVLPDAETDINTFIANFNYPALLDLDKPETQIELGLPHMSVKPATRHLRGGP